MLQLDSHCTKGLEENYIHLSLWHIRSQADTFQAMNALGTFQRCMMAIFADMVERIIEVFINDFSVVGESFDNCLENLRVVQVRCKEINLVLIWEK